MVTPPGVHEFPVVLLEVRVTLPPWQKVVVPPAVMVGAAGKGLTVTVTDEVTVLNPSLTTTV